MFSRNVKLVFCASLFCCFTLLSACGGGGSSDGSPIARDDDVVPTPEIPIVDPPVVDQTLLGSVKGTVQNYQTGEPIAGATVMLVRVNLDVETVVGTVSTDAQGQFLFQHTDIADRFILTVSGPGFVSALTVFSNSESHPDTDLNTLMLQATDETTIPPADAKTIVIDNLDVAIFPGSAFALPNGDGPVGDVQLTTALIDPSSDPAIMPGGFQTLAPDGSVRYLESFGALGFEASDATGNRVDLANGASATIRIPIASEASPANAPQLISLFRLDESSGYWIEESEAILDTSGSQAYYQGTITQLGTLSVGIPYTAVAITGCVTDALGQPISNARVLTAGRDYIGGSFAYTNAQGRFSVSAKPNSTVLVTSTVEEQSDTRIISLGSNVKTDMGECLSLTDGSTTINLTWGEEPRDLDAHLFIEDPFSTSQDPSESEVYFGKRVVVVNGVSYSLDVDDISSFGPEVITLPSLGSERYRFVVRIFNGIGTFATSEARVELNLDGQLYVFRPTGPDASTLERYWHVFDLVKTGSTYTVEERNAFLDTAEVNPIAADHLSSEFLKRPRSVKKYYAK